MSAVHTVLTSAQAPSVPPPQAECDASASDLIPRCSNALANRRRRKSRNQFLVTDPVTGNHIALNPPKDTFRMVDLMAALESAKAGRDPYAIRKLLEPYRLNGPNPRPDVARCVMKAFEIVVKSSQ